MGSAVSAGHPPFAVAPLAGLGRPLHPGGDGRNRHRPGMVEGRFLCP